MKRADAINLIRVRAFETGNLDIDLYMRNRMSFSAAGAAAAQGIKLRKLHGIEPGREVNARDYKIVTQDQGIA